MGRAFSKVEIPLIANMKEYDEVLGLENDGHVSSGEIPPPPDCTPQIAPMYLISNKWTNKFCTSDVVRSADLPENMFFWMAPRYCFPDFGMLWQICH